MSQASDSENDAAHDEANGGVRAQAARAGFAAVISLAAEHSDQVVSDGEFYTVSDNAGQYYFYALSGAWLVLRLPLSMRTLPMVVLPLVCGLWWVLSVG